MIEWPVLYVPVILFAAGIQRESSYIEGVHDDVRAQKMIMRDRGMSICGITDYRCLYVVLALDRATLLMHYHTVA
jgi:hypothetical protein